MVGNGKAFCSSTYRVEFRHQTLTFSGKYQRLIFEKVLTLENSITESRPNIAPLKCKIEGN